MKLRITRAIGLIKFSPRWVKVICLRLTKYEIERSLNALLATIDEYELSTEQVKAGNDSNLLIVFYVQIMPDDFVMQLHRF